MPERSPRDKYYVRIVNSRNAQYGHTPFNCYKECKLISKESINIPISLYKKLNIDNNNDMGVVCFSNKINDVPNLFSVFRDCIRDTLYKSYEGNEEKENIKLIQYEIKQATDIIYYDPEYTVKFDKGSYCIEIKKIPFNTIEEIASLLSKELDQESMLLMDLFNKKMIFYGNSSD